MPRLKVRTISSSAMSPRSWIRLKMRGTCQLPVSTSTPRPLGQGARDVVDPAATGDVGEGQQVATAAAQRPSQDPDLVQV